jgi:hypothetical protein
MSNINKIIEIGKECNLDKIEITDFLPNYPNFRGSEFIFSAKEFYHNPFKTEEFEFLIKGLHYIELKFRALEGREFGFGSPSRTCNLIHRLKKQDLERGEYLEEWISTHGGNYYIAKKSKIKDEGLFTSFD